LCPTNYTDRKRRREKGEGRREKGERFTGCRLQVTGKKELEETERHAVPIDIGTA